MNETKFDLRVLGLTKSHKLLLLTVILTQEKERNKL